MTCDALTLQITRGSHSEVREFDCLCVLWLTFTCTNQLVHCQRRFCGELCVALHLCDCKVVGFVVVLLIVW